jgi:NAD(P)-dependent dehydrogenase (short-subunit alcohol dehydrogenase family)
MSALAAQVVVITDAAQGIGRSTATAFAELVVCLAGATDATGLTYIIDDGWTI